MATTVYKKLKMDASVNFICNFLINAWIAKYMAEAGGGAVLVQGASFGVDVFLTTFLIGIIVLEIARFTIASALRKGAFTADSIEACRHTALLRWGTYFKTKGRSALFLALGSCLVAPLVLMLAYLLPSASITPWEYAIFKGVLCAVGGVAATWLGFGAALSAAPVFAAQK